MANELTTIEAAPAGPLSDLRSQAMNVPTTIMREALAEYAERRQAFREWLLSQLVEGVHYGTPPGCEPRGNVDERQWRHRPSLYKAGAELICDLMGVRDEYEFLPNDSEQVSGQNKTAIAYRCRLVSRANGALIGEGIGAKVVGSKGMDANGSIKMAQKTAKVAAVLNAYGLSDLFTQDLEDQSPPRDNPDRNASSPQVKPRGERAASDKPVAALASRWFAVAPNPDREGFIRFAKKEAGREFDAADAKQWTLTDMQAVSLAVEAMEQEARDARR